ncbi:MAG: hypothetical protein ACKO6N_15710 [Myxococcota bacterium]
MLYSPALSARRRYLLTSARLLWMSMLLLLGACTSEPPEPEPLMLDGYNLGSVNGFAYEMTENSPMVVFSSVGRLCERMTKIEAPTGYYWVASVGSFRGYAAINTEEGLREYTTLQVSRNVGDCQGSLLARLLFNQPCKRTVTATLEFDTGDVLTFEMTDSEDAHRCAAPFYNGIDYVTPAEQAP